MRIAPNPTAAIARNLAGQLVELLRRERDAMADFLVALTEFDRQRLWLELGHASLFAFLHHELGLSAGAAQYRKTAVELLQRHPEIEAPLRAGRLCLSSVVELARVLTRENVADVLPRFFGLSARQAAAVGVEIRPRENAPLREVLRPVRAAPDAHGDAARSPGIPQPQGAATTTVREAAPAAPAAPAAAAAPDAPDSPDAPAPELRGAPVAAQSSSIPLPSPEPRARVDALDASRSRLHITVSRQFLAKLERARSELSHARAGASAEEVLEAALDALLATRAKRSGRVEKPHAALRPAKPSTVRAGVKREVWERARGCCEWPLEKGGVCGSRLRLEIDHVVPRALGGASTGDNLRLLCRVHNQLAARKALGGWVSRYASSGGPVLARVRAGAASATAPAHAPRPPRAPPPPSASAPSCSSAGPCPA